MPVKKGDFVIHNTRSDIQGIISRSNRLRLALDGGRGVWKKKNFKKVKCIDILMNDDTTVSIFQSENKKSILIRLTLLNSTKNACITAEDLMYMLKNSGTWYKCKDKQLQLDYTNTKNFRRLEHSIDKNKKYRRLDLGGTVVYIDDRTYRVIESICKEMKENKIVTIPLITNISRSYFIKTSTITRSANLNGAELCYYGYPLAVPVMKKSIKESTLV